MLSALAPLSKRLNTPPSLVNTGRVDSNPGRVIPFILPTINKPAANNAPVFPQENNASTFPSFTAYAALTKEESFFLLIALTGSSFMSITSVVWIISIFLSLVRISLIFCSSPNNINLRSGYLFLAFSTPSTTLCGAKSPPIASTAIFFIFTIS